MIFNMGVAVTGKSWKTAIVELGKLGFAVSQLAASKLLDFASQALAIWNAWLSTCAVLVLAARALDAQARRAIVQAIRSWNENKRQRFCFQSFGLMPTLPGDQAGSPAINIAHLLRAKGDRYDEANVEERSNH